MSSNEEQQNLINKELVLNLQNQRMVEQAFGIRNYHPKRPMTTVDEETIKEYNKQFKVVQFETEVNEDGSITTILDEETGKPKILNKKFITVPPPELESIDEMELAPINLIKSEYGQDIDIEELNARLMDATNEINETSETLKYLDNQKRLLTLALNKLPLIDFDKSKSRQDNKISQLKIDTEKARILNLLEENSQQIQDVIEYSKDISNEIIYSQNFATRQAQAKAHNDAIIGGVEARNKEKIRAYQETLNIMNKGVFKEEKRYDETEQEFLNRLQDNAEVENIDDQKFEANEFQRRIFKDNLKHLVRDESIIEQVANELKTDGEQEEIRIKLDINKKFPLFKTAFTEIYGVNNRSIKAGDIIEFIHKFFTTDAISVKGITSIKEDSSNIEPPKNSYLTLTNPLNNKSSYILIMTNEVNGLHLLWSNQLKRNTFKEVSDTFNNADFLYSIKQHTKLTLTEIKKLIGWKSGRNYPDTIAYNILQKNPTMEPVSFWSQTPPIESYNIKSGDTSWGWGIHQESIPESVPFGKIRLMLHRLYYKNVLSIRRPDGTNITGFPNTPVSHEFVELLMRMIKGHNPKHTEISSLKTIEMHLYNRLITVAGLHKTHSIDSNKSIEHLKHQLTLIQGEIEAGNDSLSIRTELYRVVQALKNFGSITAKDAMEFLKQF